MLTNCIYLYMYMQMCLLDWGSLEPSAFLDRHIYHIKKIYSIRSKDRLSYPFCL